jgi:SAM-dependent methyltransferase
VTDFVTWFEALERRHLASLNFSEVRRAVQALSSLYVERRERIDRNSPFSGAGKRAALAMYFAPLHFLLVEQIVRALNAQIPKGMDILDIGCGTGAAGAAWAKEFAPDSKVIGTDRNAWALQECKWTYQQLGIQGTVRNAEISAVRIPAATAVVAAFTMNELDSPSRERFLAEFIRTARSGAPVLVVEPIAHRVTTWWDDWAEKWPENGGRVDEWRFHVELPDRLALMDRAAGLDHHELTGRSLWLPPIA